MATRRLHKTQNWAGDAKGKVTEVKAFKYPGGGLAKKAERVIKDGHG